MAKRIPHVKAGDPITADLYNAVAERLERFLNLRSGSPCVRIWDTPTGKAIALAFPEPTYALLSGSSSPYSFTEVRDGPGGTWVSMPNGDSGTAYEVNSVPNLGGKVVPIEWTSASDWRFQWIGHAPPTVAWRFRINGCSTGVGVPGAIIELYQGGILIDSCTTADGTGGTTAGECTMTVPAGSYDVVISGPPGSGFATQSFTASAATFTGRTLVADSSHVCVGAICNFPIPKTLFTTDTLGTHALTWNGANWVGTASQTVNVRLGDVSGNCAATGTCTVTYTLQGNLANLVITWRGVCCNGSPLNEFYYAADGSALPQNLTSTSPRSSLTCSPLSMTFTVPGSGFWGGPGCLGSSMFALTTPGGAARSQAVTP